MMKGEGNRFIQAHAVPMSGAKMRFSSAALFHRPAALTGAAQYDAWSAHWLELPGAGPETLKHFRV
jgi:hypothetical protein